MKPELIRFSIILLVISLVLFGLLAAKVKPVKSGKWTHLLYILLAAIAYALLGLIPNLKISDSAFIRILSFQIWLLIVGSLHVTLMYRLLKWPDRFRFGWEFVFSLIIAFLGSALMFLAYAYTRGEDFPMVIMLFSVTFLIPYFVALSYHYFLAVPGKIYQAWNYPSSPLSDPTDREMQSPIVIAFEFRKKPLDDELTNFRAKAPVAMSFGKLFYFFIQDYNARNPQGAIEVYDDSKKAFQWQFYIKQGFGRKRKYLDPDITVGENKIQEDAVIHCERIVT